MSDPAEHAETEPGYRRSLLAGAAALAVAFLAGVGVGSLGPDGVPAEPSVPAPALFENLGLTTEQRAHVDSVLAITRASAAGVLEETRLELTTIATEALDAIDPVLTPDQIDTVRARIRRAGNAGEDAGANPSQPDPGAPRQ